MADDPTEEELERLRAENEALRAQVNAARTNSRGRRLAVGVLVAIGVIALAGGAAATWVRFTALDTDTYIETVQPLPQNEAVADALATVVVDELFENLDLQTIAEENLPGPLAALAKPLEGALMEFSTNAAREVIASDAFQTVWTGLNRIVHTEAVAVLTGRGDDVLLTRSGAVSLDLGEAAGLVRTELEEAGLGDILPTGGDPVVVLFDEDQLDALQTTVSILDLTSWVLPLVALAGLGGAIAISRNRRRTLVVVGVGIAVAMALSLVFLRLARTSLTDQIEDEVLRSGVAGVWDTLLINLVGGYWAVFAIGLLIAFGAAVAGPSAWAVSVRETVTARVASLRGRESVEGASMTALGRFVERNRTALRLGGIAIAILVIIAWPSLTVGIVLVTAIVAVVYLLAIEVLREGPSQLAPVAVGDAEGEGDA